MSFDDQMGVKTVISDEEEAKQRVIFDVEGENQTVFLIEKIKNRRFFSDLDEHMLKIYMMSNRYELGECRCQF